MSGFETRPNEESSASGKGSDCRIEHAHPDVAWYDYFITGRLGQEAGILAVSAIDRSHSILLSSGELLLFWPANLLPGVKKLICVVRDFDAFEVVSQGSAAG